LPQASIPPTLECQKWESRTGPDYGENSSYKQFSSV
jgi:hypothetical protein